MENKLKRLRELNWLLGKGASHILLVIAARSFSFHLRRGIFRSCCFRRSRLLLGDSWRNGRVLDTFDLFFDRLFFTFENSALQVELVL